MKPSKSGQRHSEPLTPGNVFAHMLVSIVLLGGVWGIEWMKSQFEHGIPTLAAASVATGELAMFVYFVGALVRACKWAFSEFDQALLAVRSAHLFKDAKRAMSALAKLLGEAIPSASEILRASRFVMLLGVLAFGAVLVWTALSIFAVSAPSNMNARPANYNFNLNANSNRNANRPFGNMNSVANKSANKSINTNADVNNQNSAERSIIYEDDREGGPLSIVISFLVNVFNHSGSVAIAGSVLVGLAILTFLLFQLFRAYAPH